MQNKIENYGVACGDFDIEIEGNPMVYTGLIMNSFDLTLDDAVSLRDQLTEAINDTFRTNETARCPECGYTQIDVDTHLDHQNCRRFPFFPSEKGRSFAVAR